MTDRIEDKIQALKEQTNAYVHDIKRLVEGLAIPNRINLISYFTTSLNISYDPEQESLCLGSYHIRNIGSRGHHEPISVYNNTQGVTVLLFGEICS